MVVVEGGVSGYEIKTHSFKNHENDLKVYRN